MEWLATAILGLALICCICWFFRRKANYWKDRGIPCLESRSVVGNTFDMLLSSKTVNEVFQGIYDKLDGQPFGGYMQFLSPILMVRDPGLITQVLIKDFTHFENRAFYVDEEVEPINANLSNISGEKWRYLRHKLTPTFTSGKLKAMFDQIVYCSDNILKYIMEKGEPFDARIMMQKCQLNIIGTVAFGLNMDACKEDEATEKFLSLSRKFLNPSVLLMLKFLLKMSFPKLCDFMKLKISDGEVSKFFTKLVKDTVKFREGSGKRRNDFLQQMIDLRDKDGLGNSSCLLDLKKEKEELEPEDEELIGQLKYVAQNDSVKKYRFTDNTILAHSFLFIAGGSETTSEALSFALYQLAVNENIQTRLQSEIDSVLTSQEFTYQAVKEMTYLDKFIDEVLRMNPPGNFLVRECTKDYRIPNTDKIIEKGVAIGIPVFSLHNDPRYFPNPETFDPERFRKKNYPKGAYLPFGDGPRSCIASRFVLLEMKVILARLLIKHSVVLNEKTQLPLKMVKKSMFQHVEGGIWVEIKER